MWELIWEFSHIILENWTVKVISSASFNTLWMLATSTWNKFSNNIYIVYYTIRIVATTLIILTCFMTTKKKNNFYQSFWKKCQKHNINRNNLRSTARENTRFYTRLHILCNLINNISHRMFPINLISSWAWHHYGKNNWIFKMIYISLDNGWFSLSFCL